MQTVIAACALDRLHIKIVVEIVRCFSFHQCSHNGGITGTKHHWLLICTKIPDYNITIVILIRDATVLTIPFHWVSSSNEVKLFCDLSCRIPFSLYGCIDHVNGVYDDTVRVHITRAGHISLYDFPYFEFRRHETSIMINGGIWL